MNEPVSRINEDGHPCCVSYNNAGERIEPDFTTCCDRCKEFFAARHDTAEYREMRDGDTTTTTDYAPPDPYVAGIATLKAAMATDETRFEDDYKAARLRELDAEYARFAEHVAEPPPRG